MDIASYTKRNIEMRDGLVRRDELVVNRLNATKELEIFRHPTEVAS
jgi:hypothetical protein